EKSAELFGRRTGSVAGKGIGRLPDRLMLVENYLRTIFKVRQMPVLGGPIKCQQRKNARGRDGTANEEIRVAHGLKGLGYLGGAAGVAAGAAGAAVAGAGAGAAAFGVAAFAGAAGAPGAGAAGTSMGFAGRGFLAFKRSIVSVIAS